jgi:hypothetical protein
LYGDKQSFLKTDGTYGPLVAAYPADNLADYTNATDFTTPQAIAALNLAEDVSDQEPGYGRFGFQSVRGNFAAGDYCVFLAYQNGNRWATTTVMVPSTAPDDIKCSDLKPNTQPAGWPSVLPEDSAFPNDPWPNATDYPPTVRLIEGKDATTRRAGFLGVRCFNRDCILGASNKSDLMPPGHSAKPGNSRRSVRLWHDDQHLADPDGSGSPVSGTTRAAVIPDVNLASQDENALTAGYIHVAVVEVQGDASAAYVNRYGLAKGTNDVFLQLDPAPAGSHPASGSALIKNSAGVFKTLHVTRIDHHLEVSDVPAVARWAWSAEDEQIWVRCDVGCCMIDPDISRPGRPGPPKKPAERKGD